MVSKNQIKLITSLQHKKYRNEHQLFIAEGVKVIQELLLSNIVLEHLFVTEAIFEKINSSQKTGINEAEMKKNFGLNFTEFLPRYFQNPESCQNRRERVNCRFR